MTTMFVSFAKENAACAEAILKGLEAHGYRAWREPTSLTMEDILYPRTIENVLLGSAAVVLVWSSNAARSEWVERHILSAQRLKKLLLPVILDGTGLPNTLIVDTTFTGQGSCTDVVPRLLPHLPQLGSTDSLIILWEQAAHEFIRVRKEAIDRAAEMLQRDEHREAVLAVLEDLACDDLMVGVREKAQGVLDDVAKKNAPPPSAGQSRHIFGVRCPKGHVTYFDKRRVCMNEQLLRGSTQRAGVALAELDLTCGECDAELKVRIDCGGYR
jgi:hypothetical protein